MIPDEELHVLGTDIGTRPAEARSFGLTGREREVLAHVEQGLTNAEIARRMRIARPTVGRHLSNAMARLGAESRAHAVILANPVRHLPEAAPAVGPEARALIGRIAAGETLAEAAHALHLSRRTADRRLAHVRRALGADRTVVAVVRARGLGWLG
ncbi:MAG TPA: helix-turn-helix transcriptional regulator [Candidatus Limnocylindrales bacterium]|nr:helix-turn-helix transcriptional regulator [Candidatus Limnocylindrales bacterium]